MSGNDQCGKKLRWQRQVTLPEPAYNLDLVPINQSFIQIENTSPVEKRHEDEDDNEDEMIEYESDSDNDGITSDGNMQLSEVSRHSTFLIGGRSRIGRNIRLNNSLRWMAYSYTKFPLFVTM